MQQLNFYIRHSLNDLRVNGQRTFFALLCIAAGVAAVVSLQTVAIMMGDTLTGNLQQTNRSDIKVTLESSMSGAPDPFQQGVTDGILEQQQAVGFFDSGEKQYRFGPSGLAKLQGWIDAHYPDQVEMTYPWAMADFGGIFTGAAGTSLTAISTGALAGQVSPVLIDPAVYPFYKSVLSLDGKPLRDLIQMPTDIVIDQKVANTLGVKVGDRLRVNGAEADFTLRGIVPTEAEVTDPASGLLIALSGFYYLDRDAISLFKGVTPEADTLFLKLNNPAQVAEINRAFLTAFPYLTTTTTDTLAQNNQGLSDRITQLVTIVGLVSLLLGSIGIINTMQVIVRRRTVEVAVLKTLGLEAGQVTLLFLVEAFIMGVLGSLAGVVLGWVTTFLIKGVAENLVAQPLYFRIAPMPVVTGLIVGTLVTTIFGFLPTLAAGQVRPGVVLRPNDNVMPRAGRIRTVLALGVMLVALSFVASTILGSFPMALGVTVGAFVAAGLLTLLLSLLIWLIGRFFPSLGIVDLKLSLRQMLAGRTRAATTLLALVVGVFALSLITLMTASLNNMLSSVFSAAAGGNVMVAVMSRDAIPNVTNALDGTPGVSSYQVLQSFTGRLVSVEEPGGAVVTREQLKTRIEQNAAKNTALIDFSGENAGDLGLSMLGELSSHDLSLPAVTAIRQGRDLNPSDAGKPVMTFTNSIPVQQAELQTGDRLTYAFGDGTDAPTVTFELVGIAEQPAVESLADGSGVQFPLDALPPGIQPDSIQVLVKIDDASVPALRRSLGSVPGTFVLETAVFSRLVSSLMATFTAFPTMIALLGLVVGGVVIANSVALTTMERRREIAVMKAVGLQRERVLGMLLLENAVIGLIGGLIGVGLAVAILVVMGNLTGNQSGAVPYGTALLLMLLCVLVALVAATTTAWGASGEKPLNVLRAE